MNIGCLCKHDVVMIDQGATLQEAARQMRAHHVGSLVVTSPLPSGHKVHGVVTDRDLVIEAMAHGADAKSTPVSAVTGGGTVAVADTTGLAEAIDTMRREGVRRLLVTMPNQRLAGIVSFDDLIATCADMMGALADTVRQGIARETEQRHPISDPAGAPVDLTIRELQSPMRQPMHS